MNGTASVIDEIVHAQEQLAQRERELRNLVDTIPAMLFSSPALEGPFFMSSHLTQYTGSVPEDFLAPGGTDPERFRQELMHPEDVARVGATYARHFARGLPVVHRYRLRRSDGAWRWVESRCASLTDETGTTMGRYGIMIDIDDEVQSQRALRETQERLASAS